MTGNEALAWVRKLQPLGIRLGIARTRRALDLLDSPERSYPCIIVAGTNGKGSVVSMISAGLQRSGLRVGRLTSPHLETYYERIAVNGESITPDALGHAMDAVAAVTRPEWDRQDEPGEGLPSLTFFEATTAAALWHFANDSVDVAVLEVGLGGRLDATNAVDPILSVITSISKDHTVFLGDTVREIAREKAGILREKGAAVLASHPPTAKLEIQLLAKKLGTHCWRQNDQFRIRRSRSGKLSYRGPEWRLSDVRVGLEGRYQPNNAAVALASLERLSLLGLPVTPESATAGVAHAVWPGRFERFKYEPEILLDGAHNPSGARSLVRSLADLPQKSPTVAVVGLVKRKLARKILANLLPTFDQVILTTTPTQRGRAATELAGICADLGIPARVVDRPLDALHEGLRAAGPGGRLVVAGSLYLIGEIRPAVRQITRQITQ